jgi:hypothetical protein
MGIGKPERVYMDSQKEKENVLTNIISDILNFRLERIYCGIKQH